MTIRPMIGRDSRFFWDGTAVGELRIQTLQRLRRAALPAGAGLP